MPGFRDYTPSQHDQVTLLETDAFFPDYLESSRRLYEEPISLFRTMCAEAPTSEELLRRISQRTDWNRIQLLRIFRKFVSPGTSVEMLKRKRSIPKICETFGAFFRPIDEVRNALTSSEAIDEVLAALLFEYKDRGKKGYELTDQFFAWFRRTFDGEFEISGPERAGKDILLSDALDEWFARTPADFLITRQREPIAIGFARYDGDRGGAQEDDRISGNKDKITLLSRYNERSDAPLKCIFLNDGPGLLLGSMWEDYCVLEESGDGIVLVLTLRMLQERLTAEWLLG